MKKNKLILLFLLNLFGHELLAKDSNIYELEKRVALLEKQVSNLKKKSKDKIIKNKLKKLEMEVAELKKKSKNQKIEIKWKMLKKGFSKIKVKKDIGNPDRIGKYLNGDEIWGFKNFTLKFDNKGNLKEWSRPFTE